MKKRERKSVDLYDRFISTCGWCGKNIPEGTEVFGCGAKARPGIDLTSQEGQVILVPMVTCNKTVLVGVAGADSDAKRNGEDLVFMTCSKSCGTELKKAFQKDIDLGNQMGFGK